ncbi:site-specific DNA-methyltransferase [Acinetobacter harbinensis]|uniref:site-specific DNA-methyltransferase n=1 Tax=Acinetobacter harbinensis TaxID=1353941 RepID=UPI00351E3846
MLIFIFIYKTINYLIFIKYRYIYPYNTGSDDDFFYKDSYQHSSWCSLIYDRLYASKNLLKKTGSLFAQIDDYEEQNMRILLDMIFTSNNRINKINWVRTFNSGSSKGLSNKLPSNLDTIFWYVNDTNSYVHIKQKRPYSEGALKRYDKIDEQGRRFKWNPMKTYSQEKLERLMAIGEAQITETSKYPIYKKYLDENAGSPLDNNWYDISPIGTQSSERTGFTTQKPLQLINRILKLTNSNLSLDYFAGSGTTAHATITLNREDGGRRKYILVEQGSYFDTVIKPRIQKVVYSADWKDGKPTNLKSGISHCLKVVKLESYEDTLNNLEMVRKGTQQKLLAEQQASTKPEDQNAYSDYIMHYMLELESKDSLLNVKDFLKPFSYQMNITTDSAGAFERKNIDLVETFNYLIGLNVQEADYQLDKGYVQITGKLRTGEYTTVLWRDCEKIGYAELDQLLAKLKINPNDGEYQLIYINGDHNVASKYTTKEGEEKQLKVRSIEQTFLKNMFEE